MRWSRAKSCIFVLISLSYVSVSIAGITGKIAGVVKDIRTGEGLFGANVLIEGTVLGAATDSEGQYHIINIPPGAYNVRVSMMGYQSVSVQDVRVKIDQTTPLNVDLQPVVLEGREVVIIAEHPKVEVDLTTSKQTLSNDEIRRSWGIDLEEVISDIPGANINGGIRGGFGLDVAYHLDGMDMRDIGSNTNFTSINLSTIQEMEVLTGGWNAEYGQANGAIMNVVTKSATDRFHGTVSYRLRPPGKYHWGKNIYGDDTVQRTVMTTPEFWNPDTTWQTEWMPGPHSGYDGGSQYFREMTPEQRAEWWKTFVNDTEFHQQMLYAERMEWETEATLYGPVTSKLGCMLSARYRRGVPRYPSVLSYNPDMTFQGSFDYRLSSSTKVDMTAVYTQFENSGASRTNFASTEDTNHYNQEFPFVINPYERFAYWLYGAYSSSEYTVRAPEYAKYLNLQAKVTHVFGPSTFLEIAMQHSRMNYRMDYRDVLRAAYYDDLGIPSLPEKYPEIPKSFDNYKWAYPGDMWSNNITSLNSTIKVDFTSQISSHHQIKSGALFSYQMFDKILHDHQEAGGGYDGHLTDLAPTKSYPYEGAFYLQDKMEFQGMVVNAGVRLDFFDPNKLVSANGFDPLMISDSTLGHVGPIGHISYDPDAGGPGYIETPTQWAISPRLGISHPISETTVLHFMYGEFNQRPPWQKIVAPTVVRVMLPTPEEGGTSELDLNPDSVSVYYNFYTHRVANPALTWEKMTQYEVGVEQNVADLFSLDLTMYYKNAHNLTSEGIRQGTGTLNITTSDGSVTAYMYGDPRLKEGREYGKYQGYFVTFVNGAWANVRGIEASLETLFRHFNVQLNYTLSFLTSGEYHLNNINKVWSEGRTLGRDTYEGANNQDTGLNGSDDDSWNPHNSAFLKLSLVSPKIFGPALGSLHPFGGWTISISTTWVDGQRFTYYPSGGDQSAERVPNNKKWRGRWNTNMNISRVIGISGALQARLSAQVRNVFNQKHLKLPSDQTALEEYFEQGILSHHNTTFEPLEWTWYYNTPREIYLTFAVEF